MKEQKIILGGGIAGLIFNFYNPDFKIITKETGGQMKSKFNLGPRFLEKNKYTEKLLKDLDLKIKEKKVKVGYKKNKKITNSFTEDFYKKYNKKSRGTSEIIDNSVMNNKKAELSVFDIDFGIIVKKLLRKIKVNQEEILQIDLKNKILITDKDKYNFKKIISTIPLPFLFELINSEIENYLASDVTYVLLQKNYIYLSDYDFVYDTSKTPFHRITNTKKGIVVELLGDKTKDLKKMFGKNIIDYKVLRKVQIISGKPKKSFKGIKLLGRYGCWDRTWKVEKVIKESIEYYENNK